MEGRTCDAKRMLNPVECAIAEFHRPRDQGPEGYRLISALNRSASRLVLRKRCSLCLWFVITMAAVGSWFSFTALAPRLHEFYGTSLLGISAMFLVSLLFMALMLPLTSLLTRKSPLPALMVSAFVNALGWAVKCKGTSPTGYYVIFCGQMLIACAIPWSLGFLLAHKKEDQRKMAILGLLAFPLGSIFGCVMPAIILSPSDSLEVLESKLHAYCLWSAVVSTITFALIPFALKEQKRSTDTDYCAFVIPQSETGQQSEANNLDMESGHVTTSNASRLALYFKEFLLTRKMASCWLNFAVFLSFFPLSIICSQGSFTSWPVCLLESSVILTLSIVLMFGAALKKEYSKWLSGICQLAFFVCVLLFAYLLDSSSSVSKYTLFYFMHSLMGLQLLLSVQKLKISLRLKDQVFASLFFANLTAFLTSFLLLFLIWEVAVYAWAIGILILSIISSICFFLA